MTCAICHLPVCSHTDLEYSGISPARNAGAQPGRACGAGASVAHSGSASPKSLPKKTSFHGGNIQHGEVNVSV